MCNLLDENQAFSTNVLHTCIIFLLPCSIIIFVSFWAESSLHNAITGEASKIVSFTNSSFIEDTAGSAAIDIVESVVLFIEAKRYMYIHAGLIHNIR